MQSRAIYGKLITARLNLLLSLALTAGAAQAVLAQAAATGLLTNAVDILSLPGENAWGRPVVIRGVVTAAEPVTAMRSDWEGRFFVQDATAGVFVEDSDHRRPAPGDWVEVKGTSHPGGFAPFVSYAKWTRLGTAPLPPARRITIEELMAGIMDSQRIEVTGVVRSYRTDSPLNIYEIASGGYRLRAYVPEVPGAEAEALIGATVRVRGTASTFFSGLLRQLITVELHVPFESDFTVLKAQPNNPFAAPILPLNALGQYQPGREIGERVHVSGTVICQRPGQDVFVRDASSGLQIRTRQSIQLAPGDSVEAVGFPGFDHYLPVLEDASVWKTDATPGRLDPHETPISELHAGFRHADLIRLRGRVMDREERLNSPGGVDTAMRQTILIIQTDDTMLTAEGVGQDSNHALAHVPVGSKVEVEGVCFMRIGEDGKRQALELLLPGPRAVRVLQKPGWLTPERLLAGLGVLLFVLIVAVSWSVMVLKRNRTLKVLIKERVKAQQELQQSHDLMEWRVAERTKQLKVEMTARKEAEVQFKATLAERTRLARELHDTLEQNLTGIGLQVDTAARLAERNPAAGSRHMGIARNMMTQTQLELRRSIWDLRSRELEQFDFPGALKISAQKIIEDTGLALDVKTVGEVRAIVEIAEENLLRIAQAAISNVIKHARATKVNVLLRFEDQELALLIRDDGMGFEPESRPGASEGHFGLVGMAERVKRIEGRIELTSAPGRGTSVEIRIPLRPPNIRSVSEPVEAVENK